MLKLAYQKNKKLTILVVIFIFFNALFAAGLALAFERSIDVAITLQQRGGEYVTEFVLIALALLLYIVVIVFFEFLARRFKAKLRTRITKVINEDFYSRILALSVKETENKGPNYFFGSQLDDMPTLINEYIMRHLDLISYIAQSIFIIVVALILSWIFALVLIVLCVLIIIYTHFFEKGFAKIALKRASQKGQYITELKSEIMGIEEIKFQKAQPRFKKKYSATLQRLNVQDEKFYVLESYYASGNTFITLFMRFSAILVACILYAHPSIELFTMGSLTAAIYISIQIFDPIKNTFELLTVIQSNKKYKDEVYKPLENIQTEVSIKPVFNEKITLTDVSFKYRKRGDAVIENVNLEILKNKKYLIQGASGSGKSTLFKLLTNSLEYKGKIYLDNINMADLSEASIFDLISYIANDSYIFSDSIRRNIDLADIYSDEEIMDIINFVGLNNFISTRTLNMLINNETPGLSAGERQKIFLARALIRNTDIILLDDACAQLDSRSTEFVEDNILSMENKTILYITHQVTDDLIEKFDYLIKFNEDHHLETFKNTKANRKKVFEE